MQPINDSNPADDLLSIHIDALRSMETAPRAFFKIAGLIADTDFTNADLRESTFIHRISAEAASGGPLISLWSRAFMQWDSADTPQWAPGTERCSQGRRCAVYKRLGFSSDLQRCLDVAVPVIPVDPPIIIATEHTPWYTPERAAARSFYWRAYKDKLSRNEWPDKAVKELDEASTNVVERLADPEQEAAKQTKGLVVGYVQSGKTANFTGVIAKSIDAGYRLVIVLGGTLNLLRAQTQRRLDMELIGQENILRDANPGDLDSLIGIDYVGDDEAWPNFVQHGDRPSRRGTFDIERLTTLANDYKSLDRGIRTLEFEKRDPSLSLCHPANLHHAAARVMVVKKNKSVLSNLVKDLRRVRAILGELPTLIIDDESDQASVNTSDPKKWESGSADRTAINGLISELLQLLPRAQYVGYTATPFANVFIDPSDTKDLFPKDFLISLREPRDYMGVRHFHDLDSTIRPSEQTVANSNEKAHVRDVRTDPEDRLQEAMDSFLLSGAIKLYRIDQGLPAKPFRHHTMLIHNSVKVKEHEILARRVAEMWHNAGYSSSAGHDRLAALWAKDFAAVSAARATDIPNPVSYEELRPYVNRARQLIAVGGNPVVIVNGDTDRDFEQTDLDFDKTPNVWKMLVGGTKLSRGFTVEGLTITYYRRTTRQGDTLMQMGRWFGFRPGYRDLIRLYIGREEQLTKTKTVDLYEAFEAACLDEERFREQLKQYARLVDGLPQVRPDQIRPLVYQHLQWLKPSAGNKRFNAELVEIRSPGQPIEPAAYPLKPEGRRWNTERWAPLLKKLPAEQTLLPNASGDKQFPVLATAVSHADLLAVLSDLDWEGKDFFRPHLTYLSQLDGRLAHVNKWLLIAPQQVSVGHAEASIAGSVPLSIARRKLQDGKESFARVAGADARLAVLHLIDEAARTPVVDAGGLHLDSQTGIVLLYPVVEADRDEEVKAAIDGGSADQSKIVMTFAIIPPKSAIDSKRRLLRFQAKDSSLEDAVTVPATDGVYAS